jgi:hypothetical protein
MNNSFTESLTSVLSLSELQHDGPKFVSAFTCWTTPNLQLNLKLRAIAAADLKSEFLHGI